MAGTVIWKVVLSELFVNLSAGWFGAAVIIPPILQKRKQISVFLLFTNLVLGILSLMLAVNLRKI